MRSLLTFILCLLLASVSAQCVKKKDDMTGKVTVSVPIRKIGSSGTNGISTPLFLQSTMSTFSDFYYLHLYPQYLSEFTISKGSLVYFKFDDGSVITLPVEENDRARRVPSSDYIQGPKAKIYENSLGLTISGENINKFKTMKIVKIRCAEQDYNIKGKEQKMLSEWIKCLESSK